MNLRQDVGQLFLVGLSGTELDATERAWLRLIRPAGTVLFRRNIEEAPRRSTRFSTVLKPNSAMVPSSMQSTSRAAWSIACATSSRPCPRLPLSPRPRSKQLYREHGYLIGSELRLLGFNVAFAPVLDLRTPASAEVMRTRVVCRRSPRRHRLRGSLPHRSQQGRSARLRKALSRPGRRSAGLTPRHARHRPHVEAALGRRHASISQAASRAALHHGLARYLSPGLQQARYKGPPRIHLALLDRPHAPAQARLPRTHRLRRHGDGRHPAPCVDGRGGQSPPLPQARI